MDQNDNAGRHQWPRPAKPPAGAPNVIVFLTDDVGYGACSTFGGPIETPALDRLAREGLRFTQFHTAAICSPTRASLLTGRNPHNVAMGTVANFPTCFDGYTSVIPKSAGTVAAVLKEGGYNTAMFGKGHITPEWEMTSAGPFDRWPTGLGFEYFYGFLGFDTDMWAPQLVENTSFIEPKHQEPAAHFDATMAERAIEWISQQKAVTPDKPFFIYYATGTAHSPHHAPQEWIQKYRGKFDHGWDKTREETFARQLKLGVIPSDTKLTGRSESLRGWDSLSKDEKLVAGRLMEAYAGALSHADHQMGRVIDFLRETGQFDNTLIIFIQGDNGGSAEGGFNGLLFEQSYQNGFPEEFEYLLKRIDEIGGPSVYNHYPASWGWALNTPFQYYKQIASHFGGTRNGVVMSWPDRIKKSGEVREQFHFVSDIMPTVLEAAKIGAPDVLVGTKQDPLDGVSMVYTFDDAHAPSTRKIQVFECIDNFGIYHDGWFAGSQPVHEVWKNMWTRKAVNPKEREWELYDIRKDYSQSEDLAEKHPEKLKEMQDRFWSEAKSNNILPIHPPTVGREGRPILNADRNVFTYRHRITRLHVDAAPNTVGRSFTISATVVIGKNGGRGVLVSHGSRHSGYAFYIHDNRLFFHYNAVEPLRFTVSTPNPLGPGRHELRAIFEIDEKRLTSGGTLKLEVDGEIHARGRIDRTLRTFTNQEFNVGCDTLSPTAPHYEVADSVFDGELSKVVVNLL